MLNMVLNKLILKGENNITLEVDSNNKKEYKLYRSNGFDIKAQVYYYRHHS